MANDITEIKGVKISDLEEATAAGNLDYLIINQDGETKKIQRGKVKAQKISELTDDVGYLTRIPDEYMTESEVREFTDAEIAQIREVLNTWTSFRDNGGNINGDIKIPRGFALCGTINGNRDALIYQSDQPSDNGRVIVGSSGQTTQIASELRPEVYWNLQTHRILLDSDFVSDKNSTGYTKLPNGLILQWGIVWSDTQTGKFNYNVKYPISFPNRLLYFNTQTQGATYDYSRIKCLFGENDGNEMNIVEEKEAPYGTTVRWFAIGY